MNLLIFLFCVIFFLFAWYRLEWAVMFITAALPSYLIRFQIFGIPFTLLEAMILIAFFMWMAKDYGQILFNIKTRIKLLLNHKSEIINHKLIQYPFGVELILVLVISYIAVFAAGLTDEALGIWKAYFFEPGLFFILVLNVFKPRLNLFLPRGGTGPREAAKSEKMILSLAVGALAVSLLAVYQKFTGDLIDNPFWAAAATRRSVSFFGYPNAVGLYLGPIVMILIGYLLAILNGAKRSEESFEFKKSQTELSANLREPSSQIFWVQDDKIKVLFIGATVSLSLLAVYFAKSIGAIVGLAAACFFFGILAGKKLRWVILIATGIVIIGVMAAPSMRANTINKITFQDLSGQIRLQQWRETRQMMTASPARFIFGTGLSGYQRAIAPYHQAGIFYNSEHEPFEDFHRKTVFNAAYRAAHWQPVEIYMYPHNILFNFWTETGIAGALLFIWIIFKFFKIGIANLIEKRKMENGNADAYYDKYLSFGLLCAMIVVIAHGIVDVPYFKNDLSVLFWLLVAMASLSDLEGGRSEIE